MYINYKLARLNRAITGEVAEYLSKWIYVIIDEKYTSIIVCCFTTILVKRLMNYHNQSYYYI